MFTRSSERIVNPMRYSGMYIWNRQEKDAGYTTKEDTLI